MYVRPKKHLGQHFLTDLSVARRIADSLKADRCRSVLEVGCGTGVLTQFLLQPEGYYALRSGGGSGKCGLSHENYPQFSGPADRGRLSEDGLETTVSGGSERHRKFSI